jgi:hypothetical protein
VSLAGDPAADGSRLVRPGLVCGSKGNPSRKETAVRGQSPLLDWVPFDSSVRPGGTAEVLLPQSLLSPQTGLHGAEVPAPQLLLARVLESSRVPVKHTCVAAAAAAFVRLGGRCDAAKAIHVPCFAAEKHRLRSWLARSCPPSCGSEAGCETEGGGVESLRERALLVWRQGALSCSKRIADRKDSELRAEGWSEDQTNAVHERYWRQW